MRVRSVILTSFSVIFYSLPLFPLGDLQIFLVAFLMRYEFVHDCSSRFSHELQVWVPLCFHTCLEYQVLVWTFRSRILVIHFPKEITSCSWRLEYLVPWDSSLWENSGIHFTDLSEISEGKFCFFYCHFNSFKCKFFSMYKGDGISNDFPGKCINDRCKVYMYSLVDNMSKVRPPDSIWLYRTDILCSIWYPWIWKSDVRVFYELSS